VRTVEKIETEDLKENEKPAGVIIEEETPPKDDDDIIIETTAPVPIPTKKQQVKSGILVDKLIQQQQQLERTDIHNKPDVVQQPKEEPQGIILKQKKDGS